MTARLDKSGQVNPIGAYVYIIYNFSYLLGLDVS
jgi:hypothetical protein